MVMTYPYRVKYSGKYYAPGEPVEVKEEEKTTAESLASEEPAEAPRRIPKK